MFKVETQVGSQVLQSFGHRTLDLSAQPTLLIGGPTLLASFQFFFFFFFFFI